MPRPPRKRGRFNVFETLYKEYVAGRNVDTTIMVGKEKLNVHRNALVGVSKEFKKKLNKQRGDGGRGQQSLITLPEGTSLEAAKAFIKVIKRVVDFINMKVTGPLLLNYRFCT